MSSTHDPNGTSGHRAATKPIPDLPGYFAGTDGRIYSTRSGRWRRLGQWPDKDGYLKVNTSIRGVERSKYVHKLIAHAYLPPKTDGVELRHLDGDKTNNKPLNLVWGTQKDNAEDRDRHGRTAWGERQGAAKLTAKDVRSIRKRLARGETHKEIADRFSVCIATVGHIKSGRNWGRLE